jgi:hypothetical protein
MFGRSLFVFRAPDRETAAQGQPRIGISDFYEAKVSEALNALGRRLARSSTASLNCLECREVAPFKIHSHLRVTHT